MKKNKLKIIQGIVLIILLIVIFFFNEEIINWITLFIKDWSEAMANKIIEPLK